MEYGFIRSPEDIPNHRSKKSREPCSRSSFIPSSLISSSLYVCHYLSPNSTPMLFQTQQYVRIYNLSEQKLIKTLIPGIKWISSMDVHPSGDHLIVGGYDRKLCWFDLELSEKPYKVLRCALSTLLCLFTRRFLCIR